jgi:hypothetical protein
MFEASHDPCLRHEGEAKLQRRQQKKAATMRGFFV